MKNLIASGSLVGQWLFAERLATLAACYEEDGRCDYEDVDRALDLNEDREAAVARECDVLSVYAEEVLRFAA